MSNDANAASHPAGQDATATQERNAAPLSEDQAAAMLAERRRAKVEADKKKKPASKAEEKTAKEGVTPENQKRKEQEAAKNKADAAEQEAQQGNVKKESADRESEEGEAEGDEDGDYNATSDDADDESGDDDSDAEVDIEDLLDMEMPVKVNGETSVVPLKDILADYQKNLSASKRMEEVAKRGKELDQREDERVNAHKAAAGEIIELGRLLHSQLGQELKDGRYSKETMDDIRERDPAEWTARMKEIEQKQASLRQVRDFEARKAEKEAKERETRFQSFATEEAKKLLKHYHKSDAKFGTKELETKLQGWREFLASDRFNFDKASVDRIVEADIWRIVDMAQKYAEAESGLRDVSKQVRKAPKFVKPGAKGEQHSERGTKLRQLQKLESEFKQKRDSKTGLQVMRLRRELGIKGKR